MIVHDPRGYPPKVVGKRLAPRLSTLDGKTIAQLRFGPDGFSGDQLAFTAIFEDSTYGVYLAQVPEPGTGLLLALGLAALAARRPRAR